MMDVAQILRKLEEFEYVRLAKITGDYYTVYCPFHKGGQEHKPSCGVLLRDQYKNGQHYPAGLWHCFTCGTAKTMPEAVKAILEAHNISKSGLEWLRENIDDFDEEIDVDDLIPSSLFNCINANFAASYIHHQANGEAAYISDEELASYRYTVPYMYQRGLTDELIALYDIGYDSQHVPPGRKNRIPCITFPVRDIQGRTLFFCRRSIENKYFNYPAGVSKPVYGLYELDKSAKRVVICESCFNALTVRKYGDQAVALLGTGNPHQIKQLRELGVNEFILGFDPDDAGRRATAKLKRALSDVAIVWSLEGIPAGKDLNDLSYEEYKSLALV